MEELTLQHDHLETHLTSVTAAASYTSCALSRHLTHLEPPLCATELLISNTEDLLALIQKQLNASDIKETRGNGQPSGVGGSAVVSGRGRGVSLVILSGHCLFSHSPFSSCLKFLYL